MIFIEILLTILVWKKGWNYLSLLPTLCCFISGFIMGTLGITNSNIGILFDILAIIVLILMLDNPKTIIKKKY